MLPEFIMMETFDKNWNKLKLTNDELQIVQEQICNNPNIGDVIPGTEGLRKLRIAFPNRGKRGSGRVCYVNFLLNGVVYLISIYAKNEQSTLSQAELHDINNLIIDLKKKHEGGNKMSVGEDIIKGLQQAVEYANGNHSVGRKVKYVPKNNNVNNESIKLTIKESFSNYDIEEYLCRIEDKWGLWLADKMLDWLVDHSDNAEDIFEEQGAYDVEQFEYWVGNETIEKVILHCLETGKVEEIW